MLLLLALTALAQEPPTVQVDPPVQAPRLLRIGPIESVAVLELPPERELELEKCIPETFREQRIEEVSGRLELRLQLSGHQARAVTVLEADPSLEPLAPCFERTLASYRWAERRGTWRVPIQVGPVPPDDPDTPAWQPDLDAFEPAPIPRDDVDLREAHELAPPEPTPEP